MSFNLYLMFPHKKVQVTYSQQEYLRSNAILYVMFKSAY